MLKIHTYLKAIKEDNNDIGLFTTKDIPKGTVTWEFNPMVDLIIPASKIPNNLAEFFNYYASYISDTIVILCADNARFTNHSTTNANIKNTGVFKTNIALRDIKKDEELLINCKDFDIRY